MCDYFISEAVLETDMLKYFCEGLDKLQEEPDLMVINTSGSFLDPEEIPRTIRKRMYEELSRFKKTVFVFETHATTINEEVIDECLSYFSPKNINIEIGLESSNEWIRKHCINKQLSDEELKNTFRMLNKKGIQAIANIVIGIPFLSVSENVNNAVETINWAFRNGAARCCVFPVNIKPYTLVQWMNNNGLYKQLSLWALVDTLSRIRKAFVPRVNINWYQKSPPLENPLYSESIIGPSTCDNCYQNVVDLLEKYFLGDIDRNQIIDQLNLIRCTCREEYVREYETIETANLKERVKKAYQDIGSKILGEDYWEKNRDNFLDTL
jgi:radical SAM enzyme (TIGR01210 family)